MHFPKISIITITFNNLSGLKKTVESVETLSHAEYEHIVIDGGSSDETKAFLSNYNGHSITWVSEPDNGIYDAMNKGIKRSTGSWIIFMNAGDIFVNRTLFSKIDLTGEFDIIYGNSYISYSGGFRRLSKPSRIEKIWKGMSFTHQAVICKRELIVHHPFDLKWEYCADFEQIFSFFLQKKQFCYQDTGFCEIEAGGISDTKRYKATLEVYRINKQLNPGIGIHFFFVAKIVSGFLTVNIKKVIPKKLKSYLLRKKYR